MRDWRQTGHGQPNPARQDWEFRYTVREVDEAAQRRADHHRGRYGWWEKELHRAETAMKEKGFEYRERKNTVGTDFVAVGDPELMRRVGQCKEKLAEHLEKQQEYETWTRALAGQAQKEPDAELVLRIDDIVFFGL